MTKWTERLYITLTEEQLEVITKASESFGMTKSAYSRLILTYVSNSVLKDNDYLISLSFLKSHKLMKVIEEQGGK